MCILAHKSFACGCKYTEWTFCRNPINKMKPTLMNRLGNGCNSDMTEESKKNPDIIEQENCCKFLCCTMNMHGAQVLVRMAERKAGVAPGAREGLDFEAKTLKDPKDAEILRERQIIAFERLKTHMDLCLKIIKPNKPSNKGIMTPERQKLGIGPCDDNTSRQQKYKMFLLFERENEARKRRVKRSFERPTFRNKEDKKQYERYEEATRQLMDFLEFHEENYEQTGRPSLESGIRAKPEERMRDVSDEELMFFKLEDLD